MFYPPSPRHPSGLDAFKVLVSKETENKHAVLAMPAF